MSHALLDAMPYPQLAFGWFATHCPFCGESAPVLPLEPGESPPPRGFRFVPAHPRCANLATAAGTEQDVALMVRTRLCWEARQLRN